MIKKFINDIKTNFKYGMELGSRTGFEIVPLIKTIDLGFGKPIQIVIDPVLCKGKGFRVCATFNVQDRYIIAFDESYYTMSDECKDFIMYHEIGHIAHNHLAQHISVIKRAFKSMFNIKNDMEIQADAYALNLLGKEKSLKALNELKSIVSNKEIDLRIAEIK